VDVSTEATGEEKTWPTANALQLTDRPVLGDLTKLTRVEARTLHAVLHSGIQLIAVEAKLQHVLWWASRAGERR
jgi:hypothetical protein